MRFVWREIPMRDACVFGGRHQLHVIRVHASRVLAKVVNLKVALNRSVSLFVVDAVGESAALRAITISRKRALPHPAPGALIYEVRRAGLLDGVVAMNVSDGVPLEPSLIPMRLLRNRGGLPTAAHAQPRWIRRLWQWAVGGDVCAPLGAMPLYRLGKWARVFLATDGTRSGDGTIGSHLGVTPNQSFRGVVPAAGDTARRLSRASIIPQFREIRVVEGAF